MMALGPKGDSCVEDDRRFLAKPTPICPYCEEANIDIVATKEEIEFEQAMKVTCSFCKKPFEVDAREESVILYWSHRLPDIE